MIVNKNVKTIKQLCDTYNIGQTELARRFDIPLRTVQNWHAGIRIPPDYVVNMIEELLRLRSQKSDDE